MVLWLAPSEIRFTQDSVHNYFHEGKRLNDVIDDICDGSMSSNKIPLIRVVKRNNKYYSLDNRRLYVFRVLQKKGHLSLIKVRLVSQWEDDKFTTLNDGASVEVRRDVTYPHTFYQRIIPEALRFRDTYDYGLPQQRIRRRPELFSEESSRASYSYASQSPPVRRIPQPEKSFCEKLFGCTIQ